MGAGSERIGRSGWKAAGIALVAGTLVAGVAAARPPGGGCHEHGSLDGLVYQLEELGIEGETLEAVEAVVDRARDEARDNHRALRAAHEELRELLEQDAPDLDAVLAQADAVGALETQARKARVRAMLEIRGLVSAEQWQALKERGHHRHHRYGRRSGGEDES